MKKQYKILFVLMLISTQFLTAQRNGRMLFTARLSGSREVPAVSTLAKGLVTAVVEGNTVTINGVFDSLSGPVTACHFHKAVSGVNGASFINFLANVRGNRIYAKTTMTNAQIGAMMEDSVYFNVHTAANTGGEIRGQMVFETDYLCGAVALGANEIPAVATTASAVGSFAVSKASGKLDYKIVANGLSGTITGAHIHYGSPDRTGAVAQALTVSGNLISGSFNLTSALFDSVFNGVTYLNIHTAANPNGEIRGQIYYQGDGISFDGLLEGAQQNPAVTSSAKGAMFASIRTTFDTLDYRIQINGLTPLASNGAHFHFGLKGANGAVAVALTPVSAFPNLYAGKIALTPALITALSKDSLYANFHTTANPTGEIRGQVASLLRTALVANLCGGQETPAVTTNASGAGYVSAARDNADAIFAAVTNGLSTNASGAHLHRGAKGINGPVSINLVPNLVGNSFSVGFLTSSIPALMDSIVNGLSYFNFHTTANAGGEIRGQLGADLVQECLANSVFELNGTQFTVKVAPNPVSERLNVSFESNEQFNTQITISDLAGRQISAQNVQIQRGGNNLDVNMSNVNSGIYFIQMRQANRLLFTEKVVKN
jgi:Cu/Zn superoxide dismutase